MTDEINELQYKIDMQKKTKDTLKVSAEKLATSIEHCGKEQTEIMSQMQIKMTNDQRRGSDMSYQVMKSPGIYTSHFIHVL